MLHIAPEACIKNKLIKLTNINYLTADLNDKNAMVKMDITNIQYEDNYFDIVYCCHVLEHVPDDKKAMREFWRVLKSNGWAILLVPVDADKTIEDLTITGPQERLERFGDVDHVRCYGPDYIERLRDAGFRVEQTAPKDFLTQDEIILMGITTAAGDIYYCTKQV